MTLLFGTVNTYGLSFSVLKSKQYICPCSGAERITILCPVCRLQCQPAHMIDQRFVLEKVALDQAPTTGTDDHNPALSPPLYCS